jgi:hypothetical protein
MESPKLAELSGCSVSFWPSSPRHSSRSCGIMTVPGSVAVMARETNLKPLAQISWWNPLLARTVVCTENLSSGVAVMKSAQDGV